MKFYYSHGRTAFKYGLIYLGLKKNDTIMMPEYFCDILIDPIKKLGIKTIFYNINSDFSIDWESVSKNFKKKIKAFFFINYFGFEENKIALKIFAKKKKIFLIEDDCHSLKFNNKNLRYISDLTFYSPKKIIKTAYSGGILRINKDTKIIFSPKQLKKYPISLFEILNNFLENNCLKFKRLLKYFIFKKPDFEKLNEIKNYKTKNDYIIDDYSKKILCKNIDKKIKTDRLKNYIIWKKICSKNKLIIPIPRKLDKNTIPWVYPAYVKNNKLRKKLFLFGWKNGYSITSWPSLPKILINSRSKKRWSTLICFNTDHAPKNHDNINFI